MIIPRVKSEIKSEGKFAKKLPVCVWFIDSESKKAMKAFSEMMPDIPYKVVKDKEKADICLSVKPNISKTEEYYEISIKEDVISVDFKDFRGAINAIATLSQLLRVSDGSVYSDCVSIADYPDASFRCFMADTGRKFIPMDEFKMHILLMAKTKYNKLHIHLCDSSGFSLILPGYEDLQGASKTGGVRYTVSEMKEIIDYAAIFGIDVIPEIDLPAHSTSFTTIRPQLLCKTGDIKPNGWCVCATNPESYKFFGGIIKKIAKIFPYEYIHIGTDEISMRDLTHFDPVPVADWGNCECCKAVMKKEGIDETGLFYRLVNKMYGLITSLGKKVMMWNDDIDISKSPDLPRDILIEFWRVAGENRGPREGCSMQRFIDEGFTVVNANYPDTYIDLYIKWDRLKNWDFRAFPASPDSSTEHQIIGGDICAWDINPHYEHSLLIAIPAFADRVYNRAPMDNEDDFKVSLTRLMFGNTVAEGFSVFDYMKDVIVLSNSGEIFKEDADLSNLSSTLAGVLPVTSIESFAKRIYRDLITRKKS